MGNRESFERNITMTRTVCKGWNLNYLLSSIPGAVFLIVTINVYILLVLSYIWTASVV
jgi:hypothetical protein